MRTYRTHNLWLDQYHEKMRLPKIQSLHIAFFKKMAKSYSGVSAPYPAPLSSTCLIEHLWIGFSLALPRPSGE